MTLAIDTKNLKNLMMLFAVIIATISSVFILSSSMKVYAAPIPAGCPGSPFAGPPGPGVCEAIPVGCPGSTQAGPPAPGFDSETCPYEATAGNTEPTYSADDCSGDNLDGTITDPDDPNHCGILRYLVMFIQILSGLVGVVVAGSIIYGGIQYSSAGSDPQKVSAAKDRIRNAVIALIFFIFGIGFLNWLVPGGVL